MIFRCLKKLHNSHFVFWNGAPFARWRELRAAHVRADFLRGWSADKIDWLTLIHVRLLMHLKDATYEDSELWIFLNLPIFLDFDPRIFLLLRGIFNAMLRDVNMK